MLTFSDLFLQSLDAQIHSKHLLKHEFYQAWTSGTLSQECLKEYAKQYYHHVSAFPTYISALHARTADVNTRKVLLQNLIEEEAGSPNHPELWKRFALALGVTEEEMGAHLPNEEMKYLIATFGDICAKESLAQGVAALYSYESQIPAICISKMDGLQKHYGMSSAQDYAYFQVHVAADEEHAMQERALLARHIEISNSQKALEASQKVLMALWNFLSGLCKTYQISTCATTQN